jgi:hypothetical protein
MPSEPCDHAGSGWDGKYRWACNKCGLVTFWQASPYECSQMTYQHNHDGGRCVEYLSHAYESPHAK